MSESAAQIPCAVCGSYDTTIMPLTVPVDREFVFVSCHACESNRWIDSAGQVWTRAGVFGETGSDEGRE